MAPSFVACDREQPFLLPPDVRDWLPEDHFAWFVIDAVERIDMAAFYAAYREDGRCRPAYEPAMMLALLLYAYARGTRSSRVIERACVEDVAFRVIAAQQRPDHATIARFVERHQQALADVFGSVLGLCARAGLIGGAVVAIDGTKIHANASRDATFDYERIAREIVEEAIATDRAEDELYGEARGDELPPEISTRQGRQKWLREAQRALDEQRAREQRPIPPLAPEAAQGVKAPARGAAVDGVPGERGLRGLPRARGDEKRQADGAGHDPEAVHAAGASAGEDQHDRSGLPVGEGDGRLAAGLQRAGRHQ